MKAHKIFGSSKLILIALLLVGGLTVSAVTYADSIFKPLGLASEGSFFPSVFNLSSEPRMSEVVVVDDEPASVRTNKAHYSPGDTATITGENFGANEVVTLQVTHTDGTPNTGVGHEPWTATSDGSGFFTTTWYVDPDDSLDSTFLLTAVSATASASTTFSDPGPSADLDQCRNGSAANPNDCIGSGSGGSGWVNGNVGAQQGHFIEGYSIPYRMRMEDMEPGTWTLDIGYDTVHSSKHAIDFLTHYDLMGGSNVTPTVPSHNLVFGHNSECVDPSDTAIGTGNSNNCPTAATPTSFFDIPKPTIPSSLAGNPPGTPPCDSSGGTVVAGASSCPGTTFDAIANAGQAYMTMWNGTITNIEYVNGQQNVNTGGGKEHSMIRIYFTLTQEDVDADDGNVVLAWGGHIAREQDWGTDNSAGGISGSPYHMNLHGLCSGATPNDGTLCSAGGAQDRSLSGAAVFQTGTVKIIKNIQGGEPDGTFGYTGTGSGIDPSFNLTTVGGTAEILFEGILPGAKTVDETTIPNTHLFVSLECDDPDGGTTTDGTLAEIDLDGGETVVCTYTNREDTNVTEGRIIVVKDTVPDDATEFTFTTGGYTSVEEGNPFTLSDGQSNDSCGAGNDNCLEPGTYSVAETPVLDYETTASCSDGSPVDAISLQAGETVTCTFVNTKLTADIEVSKSVDIDEICEGSSTLVTYTYLVTNLGTASLSVDISDDNGTPGTGDDFVPTFQGGDTDGDSLLDPDETWTYTASRNLSGTTTNTVTVIGTTPGGQQDTDTATATVTAFNCTITVTKSADAETICSGTSTTYDFSITNNSDKFTWTGTLIDDKVGDIGGGSFSLAPGETKNFNDVPGPVLTENTTNTVTGDGAFDDPASSSASDTAADTVNVSDCTIDVTKTPSTLNVCNGATVTYDFSITNNSDTFTWTGTLIDDVIGDVGGGAVVLAPGETKNFNDVPWEINGTVNNTVTGDGTFNDGTGSSAFDTASATVNGHICRIILVKQVLPETDNTSTFDFNSVGPDTLFDGVQLADDGQAVRDVTTSGPFSIVETVPAGWDLTDRLCVNQDDTVKVHATADIAGPDTTLGTVTVSPLLGETITCTFTNTRRGHLELEKFTNGQARPDIDISFRLYRDGVVDGDLSGDETLLQTLSTLGDADGNLVFDEVPPGDYTVCEYPVPAGFTSMWTINGNIVTPYNPQANDTPPEDTGIRCYDFSIAPGETVSIHVDNDFPGGDPRTIGYWKNWNRCTGGGQAANADANGGGANGFWLVEDLLPQTIGDLVVDNCQDAVDILNKSDLSGKKKANDAAYELASQFLAARLNLAAGAETCTDLEQAIIDAQALLDLINFTGTGSYLDSKVKGAKLQQRHQALQLAHTLDLYNNGLLCSP